MLDPKTQRQVLIASFGILLFGFVAGSTGIARLPFSAFTYPTRESVSDFLSQLGAIGWFSFLMYFFSERQLPKRITTSLVGLLLAGIFCVGSKGVVVLKEDQRFFLVFGILGNALALSAVGRMIWLAVRTKSTDAPQHHARAIAVALVFVFMHMGYGNTFLDVTSTLYPWTFDAILYRFDATLGFNPSVISGSFGSASPILHGIAYWAYTILPFGFGALFGAQLLRRQAPQVDLLLVWFISSCIGFAGYHLLPVTGPKYAFGAHFPSSMPLPEAISIAKIPVAPAPRNGVPSMHMGWAMLLWLNASMMRIGFLRLAFAVLVVLEFMATLVMGEHYLIDLVIAIPVVIAIQALSMRKLGWHSPERRAAVVFGLGLWLAWVVVLRFDPQLFVSLPGLSWIAILATVWASVLLYRRLLPAYETAWAQAEAAAAATHASPTVNHEVRLAAALFVTSGFAGLMYEVLFSKELALTFGSTAVATYTVLATYMGGMAIGAWVGGRIAAGRNNPLVLYAYCELGIAIYCVATPWIFTIIQGTYVGLAGGMPPDAPVLTTLRLGLGVLALSIPTVLMGMTLPMLARFLETRSETLGRSVAVLYGANTLGASLGALLSGYLVLPVLGVTRTTLAAVFLNLIVSLLAFELHKRLVANGREDDKSSLGRVGAPILAGKGERKLGVVALVILVVGGMVTLSIEVMYIHLLAVVAGNSTYAFSLMLFTFLLGLGVGAEIARHLLTRAWPLAALLAWLEFGLALVILTGVFLWNQMPDYFAGFAGYPPMSEFGAREVVRGLVCLLAMLPPALLIGAIYPIAMECIGRANPQRQIRALGRAAALNTFGNIVGVLVGGFVLLPQLGALRSVQLLALVCLFLGVTALARSPFARRAMAWTPAAVIVPALAVQPASFDYSRLASGANVYFAQQGWGHAIDHAESIDGGLTSVAMSDDAQPHLTLLTNGKFQGNNAMEGEMKAQLGFAFSPLLHTSKRDQALVIGYGTGVSARTLHEAGFKQVDIVDLSADILKLANKHFPEVNGRVTEQPGVSTYVTDGRNFLLLQDRKYDVIGMEVSSIWFAGAASVYNREFYRLAKQRLHNDGVLQQWIQLHHLQAADVLRIVGSVRAEFEYVWLYEIGSQGMIIATNDPTRVPSAENLALLKHTRTLQPLLRILGSEADKLAGSQLLHPAEVDRFLAGFGAPASYWVSTDDNLQLEYSTPRGNVLDGQQSYLHNISILRKFSSGHGTD